MKKIEIIGEGRTQRIKVSTINEQPSMTQQAFKDDVDVNIILDRYMKTGELNLKRKQGIYADVSQLPDLAKAVEVVQTAQKAFDALPSKIRFEFNNDPRILMQFLKDPKNKQRGIELGLFKAPEVSSQPESKDSPQK